MENKNLHEETFDAKCDTFNWQEYLDSTNSNDVPYTLFKHVEQSLWSGLSCGMAVEAPHKKSSDDDYYYWPATITKICGPMITLRYLGAEINDKNCDVWSDVVSLRHIGYSESAGIPLKAPDVLTSISNNLTREELRNAIKNLIAVPEHILEKAGKCAVDRITPGMVVGVRDILKPYSITNAKITHQIGGRLFLASLEEPFESFWLFYTDDRIVATNYHDEASRFPPDLLMDHPKLESHLFDIGMQLEMVNPKTRASIHNGIVSCIIDNKYFLAKIVENSEDCNNESRSDNTWLCSVNHPYVFPIGWASKNNLPVIRTHEIDSETCTYKEMFATKPNARSLGFEIGMKLEAVHPNNSNAICVATIKSIHEHLLCITFDHEVQNQLMRNYYVFCNSNEIFPIYWCATNNYELVFPIDENQSSAPRSKKSAQNLVIYFNYKCRTGPMHSHKKISQLPVSIGPGEVSQVLQKVLNLLVSEAYNPLRILRLLETDEEPDSDKTLVEIKASTYNSMKEKITIRASVAVVSKIDQVASYCRNVCKAIHACPYLFGPIDTEHNCPDQCTEDKILTSSGKSRPKKYKKKGRRGLHLKTKVKAPAIIEQADNKESDDSDGSQLPENHLHPSTSVSITGTENKISDGINSTGPIDIKSSNAAKDLKENRVQKRKFDVSNSKQQTYEIKTRGAKLPNFALQIKQGHWDKKDVETLYKKTLRIPKKKPRFEYITESESDTNDSINNNETNITLSLSDISHTDDSIKQETSINETSSNSVDLLSIIDIKEEKYEILPLPCLSEPNIDDEDPLIQTNPLHWSVDELYEFLQQTNCKDIAERLKKEFVDGQAFMMLNLPFVQEYLNLELRPASMLCEHVAKVKLAFAVMNI